jgi:hypothetical protein
MSFLDDFEEDLHDEDPDSVGFDDYADDDKGDTDSAGNSGPTESLRHFKRYLGIQQRENPTEAFRQYAKRPKPLHTGMVSDGFKQYMLDRADVPDMDEYPLFKDGILTLFADDMPGSPHQPALLSRRFAYARLLLGFNKFGDDEWKMNGAMILNLTVLSSKATKIFACEEYTPWCRLAYLDDNIYSFSKEAIRIDFPIFRNTFRFPNYVLAAGLSDIITIKEFALKGLP